MKNEKIIQNIRSGIEEMTPEYRDELWETPVQESKESTWYLDPPQNRKAVRWIPAGILAAGAAMILFFGNFYFNSAVFATVCLDVNPSVSLRISRKERVVEAVAENEDAEIILRDMDLKNTDVDVAVNAVLGSLIRHGYISEANHLLLLSTECEDAAKGDIIQNRISLQISDYLDTWVGASTVLEQQITSGRDIDSIAVEYHISSGKAALIGKAAANDPSLDIASLARMPVRDLLVLMHQNGIDIREYFEDAENYYEFLSEAEEDRFDDEDDNDDEEDLSDRYETEDPRENDDDDEADSDDDEDHDDAEDDSEEDDDDDDDD